MKKNLKNIIWINYTWDDKGKEQIYEIDEKTLQTSEKLDKVNQILTEIQQVHNADHVYRVEVNTSRLVKELLREDISLDEENFS